MEKSLEFQRKTLDLSDLYPVQAEKMSPYATKPNPVKSAPDRDKPASISPNFANTIKLRTLNANLNLEFGFTNDQGAVNTPVSSMVLSSETSKQLLIALAELFQCDLTPKGKP